MAESLILEAGRGLSYFEVPTKGKKLPLMGMNPLVSEHFNNILVIDGELITMLPQIGVNMFNGYIVTVPPQTPYMVLNTSQQDFSIEFVEDPQTHEIIYDPYLMEYVDHQDFDPDAFKGRTPNTRWIYRHPA